MNPMPTGTVTFFFSDIEGSTRMARELGDDWPKALERHRVILRGAFARHSGHEVSTEGDGFFVAFERVDAALGAAAFETAFAAGGSADVAELTALVEEL